MREYFRGCLEAGETFFLEVVLEQRNDWQAKLTRAVLLVFLLLYGPGSPLATAGAIAAEAPERAPHVALLLPLESPSFARHADAVRQGFLAAARVQGRSAPPLRVYPVDEDVRRVLAAYRRALALGGSRPLPELFTTAGCRFDFSAATLRPLVAMLHRTLECV